MMNTVTQYSAVSNLKTRGVFVSRFKVFLTLFVILSLVIVLVVLAVLLANENGGNECSGTKDAARISGK